MPRFPACLHTSVEMSASMGCCSELAKPLYALARFRRSRFTSLLFCRVTRAWAEVVCARDEYEPKRATFKLLFYRGLGKDRQLCVRARDRRQSTQGRSPQSCRVMAKSKGKSGGFECAETCVYYATRDDRQTRQEKRCAQAGWILT